MNGKKARQLRQQANFNPNANRLDSQYNEARFVRMTVDKNGMPVQVVKITKSLKHETARAKYKDLKNLYKLAKV